MASVDQLVAGLREGKSPIAVLVAAMPEDQARLLRRCGVVRSFDAELVELLAADLEERMSLESLLALGVAQPLPSLAGVYRLHGSIREEQLRWWWEGEAPNTRVPDELAELSARLAEHYDARGDHVEALYHQLVANRGAGIARFQELYAEADGHADLPRCRDLVDVLGERLPLLDAEAGELRNRYRSYLDARGFWLEEWYRTARFLQPRGTRGQVRKLLRGETRVLQLWARGGMGKTMLLRWLIARHCVPEPERISCARIDFDAIVPVAAVRDPALVLLELAAQLNQQLRDAPFKELLRDHGHRREQLRLRPAAGESVATAFDTDDDSHDIAIRCGSVLAELPASERVLLVLDTLEVALLEGAGGSGERLMPLLQTLAHVHERAPRTQIVLAGRYELSRRVEGFGSLFPTARTLELRVFADAEARRYLIKRRGLQPGAELESAARVAGGVPFKLALVADILEQNPELTAEEIEKYEGVDLAYLIERVVQRVEHDVQWVLRYGVVPRVLDAEFVREVMGPHLRRGMSGVADGDAPYEDPLPERLAAERVFRTDLLGAEEELDLESLWAKLGRYAGDSSWVNVDGADPDVLRFHPDVIDPMRRLVARHAVFAQLQRDACVYFERRARIEPDHWARWMREAIFHRFELEGPQAAAYWRAQLARAGESGDIDARRELATELLGRDYLDDGQPRPWRGGTPIVNHDTLAQALFERAWADVRLAHGRRLPASDPAWSSAERDLEWIDLLRHRNDGRPVIDRSRLALVRTALLLRAGRRQEAGEQLELALSDDAEPEDRLWLLVGYADAVAGEKPWEALTRLEQALALVSPGAFPRAWDWRAQVLLRLVDGRAAVDDLAGALAAYDEARPLGRWVEFELRRGDLALRMGAFDRALAAAQDARSLGAIAQAGLLEGNAHLARWEPECAVAVAAQTLAVPAKPATSPAELSTCASLYELCGGARARLLEVEEARSAFVEAGELWKQAGVPAGVWRASYRRAEMALHELGDVDDAMLALDHAERAAHSVESGELLGMTRLLRADALARAGERQHALQLIEALLADIAAGSVAPRYVVAAELQALAIDPTRSLHGLIEAFERIAPPAARLVLCGPFERCPPLAAPESQREALRSALPDPEPGAPLPLAFAAVELARVLGRTDEAARGLERLRVRVGENMYARRRWLEAARRLDEQVRVPSNWAEWKAVGDASPLLMAAGMILGALVDSEGFQRVLDRARELLTEQRAPIGAWRARLNEAAARAARERGDHVEERRQLERAAEVYAQLGDLPARERVLRGLPLQAQTRGDRGEERETLVALSAGPAGQLLVEIDGDPRRGELHGVRGLEEVLGAYRRTSFARLSAAIWNDRERFEVDLGAALASALSAPPGQPRDLRLRIDDPPVGAIPWELACAPDGRRLAHWPDLRWVYRTSRAQRPATDGDRIGPGAVRPPGDGGLGVALVSTTRAVEEANFRGSTQTGMPLSWVYGKAGIGGVHELGSAELDTLEHVPARVVHVTAALVEARGGGAELDFGGNPEGVWAEDQMGERLSSAALDRALRRMASPPILVLDIPAPSSNTEAIAQLLLRNAFAGELFALGNLDAVIATGFARYQQQADLYRLLVDGLVSGVPLGEIATAIRRREDTLSGVAGQGDAGFDDAIAFGAVALFAHRGDIRAIAT
jgi:cellulose synthase operon protein C